METWRWTLALLILPISVASIPVIQSIAGDLEYDRNNRLASHTVVFDVADPNCQEPIQQLERHLAENPSEGSRVKLAGVEGDALDRVFGPYPAVEEGACRAACIERGVDRDLAGYVMPEYVHAGSNDLVEWYRHACLRVETCILSYHSKEHPLQVYWKRPDGVLQPHVSLEYGESHTRCFLSFLGHEFVAVDESDPENHVVVGELTVEFTTCKAWGESPPSDERAPSHDFDDEIVRTLRNEWTRHNRVTRTFSPLGFKKGRLPKDVFASLGAFYYNNIQNVVREEWKSKGVFVNWWETDVLFLQIPWEMKNIYQARLRDMVEEWAGVPVEQTVMYGLRQYTQGARLLTHVDRLATHAVSLIVNIAQGNLTEPWPVEVQDHNDRLHEVLMEPGDVVYYESAKCLHGRNRPMMGQNAYYVNMFTHYRPVNDPKWFSRPNPEGTPAPVPSDRPLSEECRLVKKGITASGPNGQSVGLVEGVECDNPDLGEFLSPDLFQALGPDDLVRWWQATTPTRPENPAASGSTVQEPLATGNEGEL
jgi:hypothetical protein